MAAETVDGNEECCGACRSGGDLICCEGCPAAFHVQCCGYATADELPDGDWLCWFCAQEKGKRYHHPHTQFQHVGGAVPIFLAVDDRADVFRRATLVNNAEKYIEVTCMDVQGGQHEVVAKTSPRLWHGTTNQAAWTKDPDGIHWRPNCRLFKVDKAALAALQGKAAQQQDTAAPNNNTTSPDAAAAAAGIPPNGTSAGRSKLKLHLKGLKGGPPASLPGGQQQPQQMQQQDPQHQQPPLPGGSAAGRQRPPAAPGRLSLTASPSLQPAGDSGSLLSPDSAGGPSPGGRDWSAALAKAEEAAAKRGVSRTPEGQVGAGLPVVQGGPGKEQFDAALHQFWTGRNAASGERVPTPIFVGSTLVEPWHFWREVWAWGGPEEVSRMKLWATVGHCFNPPVGATSISSRMRGHYDTMFAPFDKAIDAGQLQLQRPTADRQSTDRWLQMRTFAPSPGPGGPKRRPTLASLQGAASSQPGSGAPSPSNSMGGATAATATPAAATAAAATSSGAVAAANGNANGAAAAEAAAAAAEDVPAVITAAAAAAAAAAAGGGVKRRRGRPRQGSGQANGNGSGSGRRRGRPPKRKRPGQWSDNDEDDYIAAVSSDSSGGERPADSDEDDDLQPPRQQQHQRLQQQHKALMEVGSSTGTNSGGGPPGGKRLRISVKDVARELVADGLDSVGGYEYLRQPTDLVVLGKIQLTPAAGAIQVGDCVDFRQPCSSGTCVTGWRSGIVLAVAPGSEWEGGRRLLIKPRHTHHTQQQQQHSTPSLPPDSPAAAAFAAVAAAGGPKGGTAAEAAAQKLLTPSGHLRHEVAALLPARSGSVKLGSAGDTPPPPPALAAAGASGGGSQQQQRQQLACGSGSGADGWDQPQWVPMVWRGDCWQPFLAPPVLVRPHIAPHTSLVVGASGTAAAAAAAAAAGGGGGGGGSSSMSPFASPKQQGQQQELRVGRHVEVLREGCWCPAQVLEVAPGGADSTPGSTCVVLRSMAPPEADGSVWRCSGTHPMRPIHPRYTSGCGVVQCAGPEELISVAAMKKAMAPYMYSEGVHAFACIDHMRAASRAAAQG